MNKISKECLEKRNLERAEDLGHKSLQSFSVISATNSKYISRTHCGSILFYRYFEKSHATKRPGHFEELSNM